MEKVGHLVGWGIFHYIFLVHFFYFFLCRVFWDRGAPGCPLAQSQLPDDVTPSYNIITHTKIYSFPNSPYRNIYVERDRDIVVLLLHVSKPEQKTFTQKSQSAKAFFCLLLSLSFCISACSFSNTRVVVVVAVVCSSRDLFELSE